MFLCRPDSEPLRHLIHAGLALDGVHAVLQQVAEDGLCRSLSGAPPTPGGRGAPKVVGKHPRDSRGEGAGHGALRRVYLRQG